MFTNDIYRCPAHLVTRWASAENPAAAPGAGGQRRGGRKGSPCFPLADGEHRVLAESSGGSGCVRRIWITIRGLRGSDEERARTLRGMRLRCFWDGAASPAVDVPIGDFFCQGLGRMAAFENACFSSPEGRSLVSVLPMPFRSSMRIELLNESGRDESMVFYDVDFTLGDRHGDEVCYLHAHWHRDRSTTLMEDFAILPTVEGRGRFLGCCVSVIPDIATYGRTWWGEGELKCFIDDDDAHPTLCGTGTEDYIGTGWGQGQYAQQWQGCPVADRETFRYAFYRLHGPDPIYFCSRFQATMHQIGFTQNLQEIQRSGAPFIPYAKGASPDEPVAEGVKGIFERQNDDWASCAWFYLDRPENGLDELVPFAERLAGLL